MLSTVDISAIRLFVAALERRDFDILQQSFTDTVRFRALIPSGLREFSKAVDARKIIEEWFSDADVFEMEYSSIGSVGNRAHAHYRIRLHEEGLWKVCQQQVFADVTHARISAMDLLCSGFCRLT
jgi:hypothetical protein